MTSPAEFNAFNENGSMPRRSELTKGLTDQQIHARIRYLDPDLECESSKKNDGTVLVISLSLLLFFLFLLGLVRFHSLP